MSYRWEAISALGTCQCAVYGALLVIAASAMTAAALFPIWRQMEHWLMRAASAIKRDNIDFLSVLGKLTEMRNGSPKTKPH